MTTVCPNSWSLESMLSGITVEPDFVKRASADLEDLDELPNDSFVDPKTRVFPIHTKEAATASYVYFKKQAHELPADQVSKLSKGFDKAAAFWILTRDFIRIDAEVKEYNSPVLADLESLDKMFSEQLKQQTPSWSVTLMGSKSGRLERKAIFPGYTLLGEDGKIKKSK